jgi:hypothetical protein
LGKKKKSQRTGNEFPVETEYFVCPPEVQAIYGEKPTKLDVMLPVNDREAIFPQAYKYYGKSRGLKCTGNGVEALWREDNGEWTPRKCPCNLLKEMKCSLRAHLRVILPRVSVSGIYQIDTSSFNSIQDVNSGLDYVQALIGRFAMVPCELVRKPRDTHADGKKQIHYTLNLYPGIPIEVIEDFRRDSLRVLAALSYALPEPEDINPEMDESPVELVDEEDVKDIKKIEEKTISKLHIQALTGTLIHAKIEVEEFCQKYGIKTIKELPASMFDEAKAWILEESKNRQFVTLSPS